MMGNKKFSISWKRNIMQRTFSEHKRIKLEIKTKKIFRKISSKNPIIWKLDNTLPKDSCIKGDINLQNTSDCMIRKVQHVKIKGKYFF